MKNKKQLIDIKKRFAGKTKKEISDIMSRVRTKRLPKYLDRKTICVDFDETLCKHQKFGDGLIVEKPIKGAKKVMNYLKSKNYRLVVFTVRLNPSFGGDLRWKKWVIQNWLEKNEIPFDEITNNKPKAIAYIDNKAIKFTSWSKIKTLFD